MTDAVQQGGSKLCKLLAAGSPCIRLHMYPHEPGDLQMLVIASCVQFTHHAMHCRSTHMGLVT